MTAEPVGDLLFTDVRDHGADAVERVAKTGRIRYIVREGQRLVAIVPVDLAEAAERFEEAEDAEDVATARAALARIEASEGTVSLAELRAELGL